MTDKRIKELDAMVRDFTQVVPRSKSEVRQRISAYTQQQVQEAVEAERVRVRKFFEASSDDWSVNSDNWVLLDEILT